MISRPARADPGVEETGAASVVVVALTGLVVMIGLTAAFVVATAVAHRRVQSAADLAALAGATTLQGRGGTLTGDPCAAASRVAEANHARVVGCRVEVSDVVVTTSLDGPRFLGHGWQVEGRARAGP